MSSDTCRWCGKTFGGHTGEAHPFQIVNMTGEQVSSDTPTPRTDAHAWEFDGTTNLALSAARFLEAEAGRIGQDEATENWVRAAAAIRAIVAQLAKAGAENERRDAFMVTAAETLRKTEAENAMLLEALNRIATEHLRSMEDAIQIAEEALASRGRENTKSDRRGENL